MRFVIAVLLLSCLSCQYWYHPWYLIEVNAHHTASVERGSEVTFDKSARRPTPLIIALLAPDSCGNRGAATTSGTATTATVVLQVDCGETMSGIERAIVDRGWQVVSWKSIDQAVASGRSANAIEAAKASSANVLMQINSLEISAARPVGKFEISRTIRTSDHRGTVGLPAEVKKERSDALDALVAPVVAGLNPESQPGAYLDVTVILVDSGRSAWFYKWNHLAADRDVDVSTSKLFLCNRRIQNRCFPRNLKSAKEANDLTNADARARTTIEVGGLDQTQAVNATARRLLNEATADMLDQLAQWGPAPALP